MNILCNRIKELRQAQGFTQEALADQVGVTRQTIIAIERVKFIPSVRLSMEIAAFLGVTVDELFWLEKSDGNI